MAQCGGVSLSELNTLELKLCQALDWQLMPAAIHLHRLRRGLEDHESSYWDQWQNTRKHAATCDDIQDSVETPIKPPKITHAKSFQDHLGRLFFGSSTSTETVSATTALPLSKPDENVQVRKVASTVKFAPRSPGSPRSVFRRIFSEHHLHKGT